MCAVGYRNKETFVDGWLYTGDEVIINDLAELFVVDRIKELLKVRGFQVAPAELEGFLLDHPDVSDVCVVSLIDDFNGDLPLAYVVPTAAAKERIARDPAEAARIKVDIAKVRRYFPFAVIRVNADDACCCSMSPTGRSITSSSRAVLSSRTSSPGTRAGSFFAGSCATRRGRSTRSPRRSCR